MYKSGALKSRAAANPVSSAPAVQSTLPQKAVQQDDDSDDDGTPYTGGDPGYDGSTQLSAHDRQVLAAWQRPASDVDEVETAPLQPLQKTVTIGRELSAYATHVNEDGLQGLCMAVNPAGDMLAIGCRDSRLMVLDAKRLTPMNVFDLAGPTPAAIASVRFLQDTPEAQNVALVAREDTLLQVHVSTGAILRSSREKGNKISAVEVRQDGQVFATAGSDCAVRVYDTATGRLTCTLDHGDDVYTTGHSNQVYSCAWHPDQPQVLLSAGWDRTVQIWDLRLERSVRSIFGPYVCGDALDVKSGKGTVLTGSWRHHNPMQLWDFGSGRLLTNLPFFQPLPEACMPYAAKFGRDQLEPFIFGGGSGKKPCLKVYHATGEVYGTLHVPSAITSIDMIAQDRHKDAPRLVVVNCEDQVQLLRL